MNLEQFKYTIEDKLIAKFPAEPRESARLLVYYCREGRMEHKRISDLPEILKDTLIVVNDTKVLPARLKGVYKNEEIELLLLVNEINESGRIRALVNRRVNKGEEILVSDLKFTVQEDHEKSMLLSYEFNETELFKIIDVVGETPLPPYIQSNSDELNKRLQYQSIFADSAPSVAAPTASLHFTDKLIQHLKSKGVIFKKITLQVGLGTFAPIFEENFKNKKLHTEYYSLDEETSKAIKLAMRSGIKVVAVGTTVARVLETTKNEIANGISKRGKTDIFIFPPYKFSVPDILMTNFHVPKSSLMCLVEAYLRDKKAKHTLVQIYTEAIKEQYRFYSFGDAMIILP